MMGKLKLHTYGYIFIGLILTIIYWPLLNIITESVSNGNPVSTVTQNESLMQALYVSIYVTIVTVVISIVVATVASIGLSGLQKENKFIMTATKLPLTSPDIIIALGISIFLLLFLGKSVDQSGQYTRVIIAHLSFGVAYAFITIYPVARKLGKNLTEASIDLGAGPVKTLLTVVIPNLKWAIVAGATITFVMSFDDYIITKMAAPLLQNISVYFYSARRITTVLPSIYALTSIMVILTVLVSVGIILVKRNKKSGKMRKFKLWKN